MFWLFRKKPKVTSNSLDVLTADEAGLINRTHNSLSCPDCDGRLLFGFAQNYRVDVMCNLCSSEFRLFFSHMYKRFYGVRLSDKGSKATNTRYKGYLKFVPKQGYIDESGLLLKIG
jgi:hypothetical protein